MNVMRKYLTEDEQRLLLSTVKLYADVLARRDSAWLRLLQATGLRIGEFSVMTLRDARAALRDGYLFVPREHRKGKGRDHHALVTAPVREALADLLTIHAEMTAGAGQDDEPLVVSRKHCAMTVRGYEQRVALWAQRAGLPMKVSPHWMRHTRAMNIMRRSTGRDPRGIVQAALGHADIRSSGIYTQPSREEVERELEIVDGTRRASPRKLRGRWEMRVQG